MQSRPVVSESIKRWLPAPRVNLVALTNQRPGERSRTMIIVGADYHPGFQQIAYVEQEKKNLSRPESRFGPGG